MKSFEKIIDGVKVRCDMIPMGDDITVLMYGGDFPHIVSTALSIPRPSLTGKGRSATTSILNCLGHKDDALAKLFAEKIAVKSNHTAVCVCGIHVDNLSPEHLKILYDGCLEFLEEVLADIPSQTGIVFPAK